MVISKHSFTPFIPQENILGQSGLSDKALLLSANSAKLAGSIPIETRDTLIQYMMVINSYYSNLIEGNHTEPFEIRAAQRGEYASEKSKRDLQLESIAHIKVQQWLNSQSLEGDDIYSVDFIKAIHREFYQHVPESLRELKNRSEVVEGKVIPGEWRSQDVVVGNYVPPEVEYVQPLMTAFCEIYNPSKFHGDKKVISIMCAHHRFAWIHPFADGNGRVARLLTDYALKSIGIDSIGIWCLSRGLAKSSSRYKKLLEHADKVRQGDYDGIGQLSESALIDFCKFMLDTSLDQVKYIDELLHLKHMHLRIQKYVEARNDARVNGYGKLKKVAALIIYNTFVQGKLDRKIAIELSGMPDRTARKLLAQLREEGLLSETSSRSPFQWEIPEHAEPWYFPQLTPGL